MNLPQLHWFGSQDPEHLLIYVHGWGVNWTSKDLFTDLAENLADQEISSVLFDLSDYEQGNINLLPLSQQIERLGIVVNHCRQVRPQAKLSILAHSLGCIVGTSYLKEVDDFTGKFIMLAPAGSNPGKSLRTTLLNYFGATELDDGTIEIIRKSGRRTTCPVAYLKEFQLDVMGLYKDVLPKLADYSMILAEGDRERHITVWPDLLGFDAEVLEDDHNFNGQRSKLAEKVTGLVLNSSNLKKSSQVI